MRQNVYQRSPLAAQLITKSRHRKDILRGKVGRTEIKREGAIKARVSNLSIVRVHPPGDEGGKLAWGTCDADLLLPLRGPGGLLTREGTKDA